MSSEAGSPGAPSAVIDHLVIGAIDLEEGAAWAETTLGVPPGGRGKHALMGTHNLLWRLDATPGGRGPAYLEVVAVDPEAPDPRRPRWFGLDDARTRARLAARPRLLTWQVRAATEIQTAIDVLSEAGIDAGPAVAVTRDDLSWRLTVPEDGMMPLDGLCPVVIEWDEGCAQPPARLPPSGLALTGLAIGGPAPLLPDALAAIGAGALVTLAPEDVPGLAATVVTPRGEVLID
ncbi:MAG: VOC family protein [Pseudomonadota bacterium]